MATVAETLEMAEGPAIISIERWESRSFAGYRVGVSDAGVADDADLPMPRLIVASIVLESDGTTTFLLVAEKPYLSARPAGAALIKALRAAGAKAREQQP